MTQAFPIEAAGIAAAPSAARSDAGRLTNLQVLRAAAAGFVALLHCATEVRTARLDDRFVEIFNLKLGLLGVALFFAMSGFLMAQLLRSTAPGRFLVHRVARIYPTFLIVAGAHIALGLAIGLDVRRDWLALTLVPAGQRAYTLGVEWTLLYETTFYVLLFLIAAAGLARRLEVIALGWLGLILAASLGGFAAGQASLYPRLDQLPFADVNAAFAAGLLLPWAMRRGLLPARLCLLAAPTALAAVWWDLPQSRWIVILSAPLIVAGAAGIAQLPDRSPIGRGLIRLGDWSYALYLAHMPAIVLAIHLAPRSLSGGWLFVAALALSLLAAAAFGSLDVALYRHLRRAVDRMAPSRSRLAAGAFALAFLGTGGVLAFQIERREREDERARAAVSLLPRDALAGGDPAQAVTHAGLRAPDSFVGALEKAVRIPGGPIEVVGWAVDLSAPDAIAHLVLACRGEIVAIGRPQRLRPDVAAARDRPDLARRRIGFTLMVQSAACPAGEPLVPVFVDAQRRLLPRPALVPTAPGS